MNVHVESHGEPCDVYTFSFKLFSFGYYINECLSPLETHSLDKNKLLYEWKVSSNKVMKGIEILVFKSFGTIYDCVKSLIG
jgi:hypothetical protein